jgi:hypothetical protein
LRGWRFASLAHMPDAGALTAIHAPAGEHACVSLIRYLRRIFLD